MIRFGRGRSKAAQGSTRRSRTAISFSAEDLAQLARLVAAGQVLLQTRAPVVSRLKAALTRMKLPIPHGL